MRLKRLVILIFVIFCTLHLSRTTTYASDLTAIRRLEYRGEVTIKEVSFSSYLPQYGMEYIESLNMKPGLNIGIYLPVEYDTFLTTYLAKGDFESTVNKDFQLANGGWEHAFRDLKTSITGGSRDIGGGLQVPSATYDFLFKYTPLNTVGSFINTGFTRYEAPEVENDLTITVGDALSLFDSGQLMDYRDRLQALQESFTGTPADIGIAQAINSLLTSTIDIHETVTLSRKVKFLGRTVYKPYLGLKPHLLDRHEVSLLATKNNSLLNTVKSDALQVTLNIRTFKNTGSPILLDSFFSPYGMGSRLENFINTNITTLPKKVTVKMLPETMTNTEDNAIAINNEYRDIINDTDMYMSDGSLNFFRVRYPLKQVGSIKPVDGKDGTFTSDFTDIGEIDLIKEDVYMQTDSGDRKQFGIKQITGDIGNALRYVHTAGINETLSDVGYVQSDRLMECVRIGEEYLVTGRVLNLPLGEFNDQTLLSYASSELKSATKPKVACYMFNSQTGEKSFQIVKIDTEHIIGNAIVLNPTSSEASGIFDYFNNIASDDLVDTYGVDVTRIVKYLRGGGDLPTGTLTYNQIQRINAINAELRLANIVNTLVWIRTSLVVLGILLLIYSALMFVGLALDRSGGIFGVCLIPLLTFGKLRLETTFGSSNNAPRVYTKRVWGAIIGSSILGIALASNIFYELVYSLIMSIYTRIGG